MLDLPEQLISMGDLQDASKQDSSPMSQQGLNRSLRAEMHDSSSTHSSMSGNSAGHSTADFLRGGSSSKSMRFMNIFLEVLRVLSRNKLLCLCLDDLQFADEESLELLSNIVSGELGVVLMVLEHLKWLVCNANDRFRLPTGKRDCFLQTSRPSWKRRVRISQG